MNKKLEKRVITIITIITAIVVLIIYLINGAEKDDAWLYLTAVLSILTIPTLTHQKKDKE